MPRPISTEPPLPRWATLHTSSATGASPQPTTLSHTAAVMPARTSYDCSRSALLFTHMSFVGVARVTSAMLVFALVGCDKSGGKTPPPASPPNTGSGSQAATVTPPKPPDPPEPGTWYHAKLVYKDLGELP